MDKEKFREKVIETYGEWPSEIKFGGDEHKIREALQYFGSDLHGLSLVNFLTIFLPSKYLHIGDFDLLDLDGLKFYNSKYSDNYGLELGDWRAFMINDAAVPFLINTRNGRVAVLDAIAMIEGAPERPIGRVLFQEWMSFDAFLDIIKCH